MATKQQSRSTSVEILTVSPKLDKAAIIEKQGGRPLGSPINSHEVGDTFTATLTGKIEIRLFEGQKAAYHLTKEGYSIRVNASYDPALHKENAPVNCVCREFTREDKTTAKFTSFALS